MATPEVEVKSRLTGSAVKAMVIESFFCASPPLSEAPAEQPVISRLVAAAAATHVMMRGVFIVLLDFADHEEGRSPTLKHRQCIRSSQLVRRLCSDAGHSQKVAQRFGSSARIAARASKANRRWDREFFSSAVISAALSSDPSGTKIGS
jgi:hypothetical protein